ncbi:MAG TPA: GNAT family N-acetyltransferase [Gaiellales bacterium]|nr:GNAT family N-acetyltransferase [Gaiellales bacterium]
MTIAERIRGRLVTLAPLRIADLELWVRWLADADTTRYLYGRGERPPAPPTAVALEDWGWRILADPFRIAFGLEDAGSGQVIGNARLSPMGGRRSRFSIVIGEAGHRGRGLGTEATAMVCDYGFRQLGLREVVLDVDPRNAAAVAAYRRAGFRQGRGSSMHLRAPDRAGAAGLAR